MVEPRAYGPDLVEIAADATDDAFGGGRVVDDHPAPTDHDGDRAGGSADRGGADLAQPEVAS